MPRSEGVARSDGPPVSGSAAHAFAEFFGGHAGGAFEGDAEAVDALITAVVRDGFDLLAGLGEEFFGAFDAHALEFLAGGAAEVFQKSLVKAAPGHGGDGDEVLDADGFVAMFPDMAQAPGNALVLDGED